MAVISNADRWNQLVSLATLGTARAGSPAGDLWPEVSLVTSDAPPGKTLLRAAAATLVWQLAGTRASQSAIPAREETPVPPPRVVSEAAAWRLCRMLNGERRELIPEWCAYAAQANAVLPPHWLPPVLNKLDTSLAPVFRDVLGPHAVWLAAKNPAWAEVLAVAAPSEESWVNGTLEERRAALLAMRKQDPARARAWIENTWNEDPPEARAVFIETLLTGLEPGDEPLLERALDDKRKSVRRAAVECLARLPESAHARRCIERARAFIRFQAPKSRLFGSWRLEIELPTTLDASAARDGIEAQPPADRKVGQRVYWLAQMVAMVPPRFWLESCNCKVAELMNAVLATEYATELVRALIEATLRCPDDEWIAELCRRLSTEHSGEHLARRDQNIALLINAASADARESILPAALKSLGVEYFDEVNVLLSLIKGHWSETLTQTAFKLLAGIAREDKRQWSQPRNALATWGTHAHVDTAAQTVEEIIDRLPGETPWRNAIEQLAETLSFRASMKKELLT